MRLLTTAVRYWVAYPGEVDGEIAAAEAEEEAAEQTWLRSRSHNRPCRATQRYRQDPVGPKWHSLHRAKPDTRPALGQGTVSLNSC